MFNLIMVFGIETIGRKVPEAGDRNCLLSVLKYKLAVHLGRPCNTYQIARVDFSGTDRVA